MQKVLEIVILVVVGALTSIAVALAYSYFFMLAWNYSVPYVFGLPEIDFWKSFALLFAVGCITPKVSTKSSGK